MFLTPRPDDQQRRLASPEANIFNKSDFAVVIKNQTAYQIADVSPARLKLRSLAPRHLQCAAYQGLGVGDRIHSRELQRQAILVRPQLFNLQLPPGVIRS